MEKRLTDKSIIEIISGHNGTTLFNEEGVAIEYEFLAKNNKICVLVLPNGIDMAISFLALANYVTVSPLNPSYTREEFLFFLEDLDCDFIISDDNASNALIEAAKLLKIKLFYIESYSPESELLIKSLPTSSISLPNQNKTDDS